VQCCADAFAYCVFCVFVKGLTENYVFVSEPVLENCVKVMGIAYVFENG